MGPTVRNDDFKRARVPYDALARHKAIAKAAHCHALALNPSLLASWIRGAAVSSLVQTP